MKYTQIEKLLLRKIDSFQSEIVNEWNPKGRECTSLIIPPVSLRDEIKTNGYGYNCTVESFWDIDTHCYGYECGIMEFS